MNSSASRKYIGRPALARAAWMIQRIDRLCCLVRFTCILLVGLALLNARYFSQAEIDAMAASRKEIYGSDFFPGLHSLQSVVFERSLTGPWIRKSLGFLLIKPTESENKDFKQKEYELPK